MTTLGKEEILKLSRDFMECQILLAGAELNLFTHLTPTPLSAREVAKKVGADLRGLTILLDALVAIGLLVKKEGNYQCSSPLSALLSDDGPDSVLPLVLHMAHVQQRWSDLAEVVRGSRRPAPPGFQPDAGALRAFIGAMHVIATPLAPKIVAAVHPETSRALLDVGGACGTYTLAFLQAVPEMRATLFDKPEVIEIARQYMKEMGMLHRVTLVAGDFYRDELPSGHDLVLVSAIIHQNSPEENRDLFSKAFRCLKSGGRIVIRDHVMDPDRTRPRDGAIFAVNMLVGTTGGRTYSFEEIRERLTEAGFLNVRILQSGSHMDGIVEAYKP